MTKATIAGLVAFINAQPAGRKIDHTNWDVCVVGDYAQEVLDKSGVETAPVLFEEVGTYDIHRRKAYAAYGYNIRLITFRVDRSVMDELGSTRRYRRSTYGQLRIALGELFPQLGFKNSAPALLMSKFRNLVDQEV